MAGHIISRYLDSTGKYEIIKVDHSKYDKNIINLDVTEKKALEELIEKLKPNIVINAIGILVKDSDSNPLNAIYLNSYFPHQLSYLGNKFNFKLIHLSTDCVFSGNEGGYVENSFKDGVGMYEQSKSLGEIKNKKDLTIRMSIIGPELNENGTGLMNWVLKQTGTIYGYNNVYWTGVTTLELAKGIDAAIDQNITSLYHLIPDEKISKFDLLNLIKEVFNLSLEILKNEKPKHDKSLINTREDFNYNVKNYREMLVDLKNWMSNWDYNHYNL
jgi:dTDP-4-dehydrorhamnose reductase